MELNSDSNNTIIFNNNSNEKDLNIGNLTRISNLLTLRSSTKNSITNFNAFQKVFRSRFDEGRAHITSNDYADLNLKQPYIFDKKIPYLNLLGKNKSSFYETPSYKKYLFLNFNSNSTLQESLITPAYDFPFLLAMNSDIIRHI
jgi:hypothetical protein